MTQQHLDFGTGAPNDGDTLADGFGKTEDNFTDLYTQLAALQVRTVECTVGGTSNAIVLTPVAGTPTVVLADGMRFSFTPTATTDTSSTVTIAVTGVTSAKTLKAPDGYTFALWGDIQKNQPTTVRYAATQGVFVLASPPLSFKQSIFGNGQCKLQANGTGNVALTQENGQGLLVYNPTSGVPRLIAVPTTSNTTLFSAVNNVEGVANQALSANQLYSVYMSNTDGTNDQAVELSFWRMYTGVGVTAWIPTTNEWGYYVSTTAAGGSTPDSRYTYVGQLWTGSSDISTVLTGTALQSMVQSHYQKWRFPVMSDVVTYSGFTDTSATTKTGLSATFCADGITDCPVWEMRATVSNDTAGQTVFGRIIIDGTSFNGTAFSATSPTCSFTSVMTGAKGFISPKYGVACPRGVFRARPQLWVDAGAGTADVDFQCVFAN